MNRQEMFDTALAGLRKQGMRSKYSKIGTEFCAYRGKDDCKCAVGHLIPDERYHPKLEGRSANHPSVVYALLGHDGYTSSEDMKFLQTMQSWMHDSFTDFAGYGGFQRQLEEGAARVANAYNLTYTPPVEEVA